MGLEFILSALRDGVGFHVPPGSGIKSASMSWRPSINVLPQIVQGKLTKLAAPSAFLVGQLVPAIYLLCSCRGITDGKKNKELSGHQQEGKGRPGA